MPDTQVNRQGSDQIVENRQQNAGQPHGNGPEPRNLNAMNPLGDISENVPRQHEEFLQRQAMQMQAPQMQVPQMQALYGQGLQPQYIYAQPMNNFMPQPMYNFMPQPMYNFMQQPMYNYGYMQQPQYGVVLNPQARGALEDAVSFQDQQARAGENEEIRKALIKEGYDPEEFDTRFKNWPKGGGGFLKTNLFGRFISDRKRVEAMLNDLDRLSAKSTQNGGPELGAAMRGAFKKHLEGLNQPGDHLETFKTLTKSIQEFRDSYEHSAPGSPFIPEAYLMYVCVANFKLALDFYIVQVESEAKKEQARVDGGINEDDEPAEVWKGDPVSTGKILETLNNPVTVRAMLQDLRRISDDSVRREQGEVAPDVRKSFEKLLNALEIGGNGSHMAEIRELYANIVKFSSDAFNGRVGASAHVALVSSSLLRMRTSLGKKRLDLADVWPVKNRENENSSGELLKDPDKIQEMIADLEKLSQKSEERNGPGVAKEITEAFRGLQKDLKEHPEGNHAEQYWNLFSALNEFRKTYGAARLNRLPVTDEQQLVKDSVDTMRIYMSDHIEELAPGRQAQAPRAQDADEAEDAHHAEEQVHENEAQVNEARPEEAEAEAADHAADHAEDDLDEWFEAADDAVNAAENKAEDQVHSDPIDIQNSEASVRQNQEDSLNESGLIKLDRSDNNIINDNFINDPIRVKKEDELEERLFPKRKEKISFDELEEEKISIHNGNHLIDREKLRYTGNPEAPRLDDIRQLEWVKKLGEKAEKSRGRLSDSEAYLKFLGDAKIISDLVEQISLRKGLGMGDNAIIPTSKFKDYTKKLLGDGEVITVKQAKEMYKAAWGDLVKDAKAYEKYKIRDEGFTRNVSNKDRQQLRSRSNKKFELMDAIFEPQKRMAAAAKK